ncbi:MAG: M14 family zinc carboxypeptidase [Gammaproteobacteria bacterium]|nr:M14 family zinc carboxypeptidase [Gammaproteobacteria bacterium]
MAPWNSTRTPIGRLSACTTLTAILTACSAPAPPEDPFLTRAERTGYRETSSYADVVDFLERAAAASPSVHYTTYGFTTEGRALPLAVVGDIADPTPAAVRASGKTVVYLQGNIHAGEVCGKEALQMLLRDLLAGRHGEWRDSMVLLIAPIYNADGNERVTLTNRGRQHGPIGGMGQRPNAQGYDLNRDHMKLDSPEARSVARLFTEYNPHVAVDLHTTNGTRHAYHLTYSPPLHPNTPAGIDAFLRQGLLPRVTEQVRDKHGWHYYYPSGCRRRSRR